jgi:hypothetical protein
LGALDKDERCLSIYQPRDEAIVFHPPTAAHSLESKYLVSESSSDSEEKLPPMEEKDFMEF